MSLLRVRVFLMGGDLDPPPKYRPATQLVFTPHQQHRNGPQNLINCLIRFVPFLRQAAVPWFGLVSLQTKVGAALVRWGGFGSSNERQP